MPERNRRDLLYLAKLAEQAERHQEMVDYMKGLARNHSELNHEERSYFSVAYKNLIGARRTSWRILGSTLTKEENKGSWEEVEMIKKYRKKIEGELTVDCLDCINTVETHLLPYASSSETKVFWRKMIGDYHRYLAEIAPEDQRRISYDAAYEEYTIAMDIAPKDLAPTNPVRLGVQLSFAVYYFEIQKKPHLACKMAQQAFDEAISRLDTLREDSYRESTLIMQLLRDNLTMWKAQMEEEDDGNEHDDSKGNSVYTKSTEEDDSSQGKESDERSKDEGDDE